MADSGIGPNSALRPDRFASRTVADLVILK